MDMLEQTRDKLTALLPPAPPEEAPAEVEGSESLPRGNGLLETVFAERGTCLDAQCDAGQIVEAAAIMNECGWVIEAVTGVDWIKEERFEVLYDFVRYDRPDCRAVLRTFIPRSEPRIETISHLFSGADWHERETHDFFGIVFTGHPNLEPLLLPEDADFHPLLKDFKP